MDATRIISAQSNEIAGQPACTKATSEQREGGIRLLAEWELLLAGGGEVIPGWPDPDKP